MAGFKLSSIIYRIVLLYFSLDLKQTVLQQRLLSTDFSKRDVECLLWGVKCIFAQYAATEYDNIQITVLKN